MFFNSNVTTFVYNFGLLRCAGFFLKLSSYLNSSLDF